MCDRVHLICHCRSKRSAFSISFSHFNFVSQKQQRQQVHLSSPKESLLSHKSTNNAYFLDFELECKCANMRENNKPDSRSRCKVILRQISFVHVKIHEKIITDGLLSFNYYYYFLRRTIFKIPIRVQFFSVCSLAAEAAAGYRSDLSLMPNKNKIRKWHPKKR